MSLETLCVQTEAEEVFEDEARSRPLQATLSAHLSAEARERTCSVRLERLATEFGTQDELVLGPVGFNQSRLLSSVPGVEQTLQLLSVEQQSTMLLETLCVKTKTEEVFVKEDADMCEDEARAHVKEAVECEDSAALCELYAEHQVKDELVLGPVEFHRPRVLSAVPGQIEAKTNKRQARVRGKKEKPVKENTARRGPVEKLQDSTSPQVESPMNTNIREVPPEKPAVNTFTRKTDSNVTHFKCDQCSKCFNLKSDLEKHIQTHELLKKCTSLKASKDFTCQKCTCTFATKLLLLEHAKSRHDVKYFACSECECHICHL